MSQVLEQQVQALIEEKLALAASYADVHPGKSMLKKSTLQRAELIAAKLTSHQFCKQRPQDKESFLRIILEAVITEQPIDCIVGHGPLKIHKIAQPLMLMRLSFLLIFN
jgi:hypothetical protein